MIHANYAILLEWVSQTCMYGPGKLSMVLTEKKQSTQ